MRPPWFWRAWLFFSVFAVSLALGWPSFGHSSGGHASGGTTGFEGRLLYGASNGFWGAVHALESSSESALADQLERVYNNPRVGLVRVDLAFLDRVDPDAIPIFHLNVGYISIGADLMAGGQIQNRILPEFKGYEVHSGHVSFGFLLRRENPSLSGWEGQLGTTMGAGSQKLLQADYSEMFPRIPWVQSSIFYWGLDLSQGYRLLYSDRTESWHALSFQPTFFHASAREPSLAYAISADSLTLRWKWQSHWQMRLGDPEKAGAVASVFTLSGPQPVPVEILPRTWDSVHKIKPWTTPGAMIGVGTGLSFTSQRGDRHLRLQGGFFGGYLGAGAQVKLWGALLDAGTWGFEQGSGFRSSESRIEYVSLGYRHAF